jgi:hypothetical protein
MAGTGTKRQTPARQSTPRKAAPRKRAATRAGGTAAGESTSVDAVPSPEESQVAAATNGHSKAAPPPDEAMVHGYPRGTLVFPHIVTVTVDPVFFYDIYDLPEMYQTFEWMKRAGVPHEIGRTVMALPITQRREFLGGWFQGMKERPADVNMAGGMPGESKSSPSASESTGEPSSAT